MILVDQVAWAQYKGYSQVNDPSGFKKALVTGMSKIQSVSYDVLQEKELGLLDEKLISQGSLTIVKPNKFRLEYTKPYAYIMVINNQNVQVKSMNKTSTYNASTNRFYKYLTMIMASCFNGTALDNADFKTRIFQADGKYLIEMNPVKKDMKALFSSINIYLSASDMLVSKIDLKENSGDRTTINLKVKSINAAISDKEFNLD
jgi:outer membrane lipoprotein-sorting protein